MARIDAKIEEFTAALSQLRVKDRKRMPSRITSEAAGLRLDCLESAVSVFSEYRMQHKLLSVAEKSRGGGWGGLFLQLLSFLGETLDRANLILQAFNSRHKMRPRIFRNGAQLKFEADLKHVIAVLRHSIRVIVYA